MPFFRRFTILLAAFFLVLGGLIFAAGSFLLISDDLERADLCLVMGGSKERAVYAIQLYHGALCARLVFISGHESSLPLTEGRKALALEQQVPVEAIISDPIKAYSTYHELTQFKALLDADPTLSRDMITVISDPYHMRRTRIAFRWIFGNQPPLQMAAVPFPLSSLKQYWWTDSTSANMVMLEYIKIIYYWLRYRLNFTPLSTWLTQFEKEY